MFLSHLDPFVPQRVTLAGAPAGHDVRVVAELAVRLAGRPVIHVALDDVRAAVMAEALAFFAPSCDVLTFPAWDCLPYDRVSPHADVVSQRIATLSRLQKPVKRPTIILTTINAMTQKTLPPDVLKRAHVNAAVGEEIAVDTLRAFLVANGYVNASTVREAGEFAVRGGIVDLFPPGYDAPLRLDFFGDEIESIRVFDPLTQTTTEKIEGFQLGPISEVLLDERSIAAFRATYRQLFGAVTDKDALYEAVTAGRKFPGVEHWLGLFYPELSSLFDYAPDAAVTFDPQADAALAARFQQIEDFYQARWGLYQAAKRGKNTQDAVIIYKPAPVASLFLDPAMMEKALAGRFVGVLSPFGGTGV